MTPIDLDEEYRNMTKKELQSKLMEMPKLESVEIHQDRPNEPEVEKHKWLNDINTFQAHKNEFCLRGTDEDGKDVTIWFDSYDFLKWIDTEQIEYIKKCLIKYIEKK